MRELTIAGRRIADDTPSWIAAEIGHNHQGDLQKARMLVAAAAEAGVDAVKFQKRDNATLFTRDAYRERRTDENAFGATTGEHRSALELDVDALRSLQDQARSAGVSFFATVFDVPSAEHMCELGVPVFKMASGDLLNLSLLEHVARLGRPMILSTGGASMDQVERVHDHVARINPAVALLQCTAAYPTEPKDVHLRVIEAYRERFPHTVVGLSYHGTDWETGLGAFAMGARIHEQHFTLDRSWKGTDQAFSLEPGHMKRLVEGIRRLHGAMGGRDKRPLRCEEAAIRAMGKKLVATRALPAGHRLDPGDVTAKSPGDGLPPIVLDEVVGRVLLRPLASDEALSWDALE